MSGCFDLQDVNNIFSLPFVIHLSVLKTLGLTFCLKEVDESKEPLCAATNMLGIAFLINISPTEVNGTLSDISRYIYNDISLRKKNYSKTMQDHATARGPSCTFGQIGCKPSFCRCIHVVGRLIQKQKLRFL